MADGIYYDGSNKQLKFTVSGSNVMTLASGSGLNFINGVTASGLTISSSNSASIFTVTAKDSNSVSKYIFPISDSASYFMECMSGSSLGDFRLGISASIPSALNGIQELVHVYAGGLRNVSKVSYFANNSESLSINDSGTIVLGNTSSFTPTYIYVNPITKRIGFNTQTPSVDVEFASASLLVSGNVMITGSLSVGFNSLPVGASATKSVFQISGNLLPSGTLAFDLGSSSLLWNTVYVKDGIITPSDRDIKTDIYPSDLGIDFINSLQPVSYKFINGTSGRTHYGLIAQDVEQVLVDKNKSSFEFGGIVKNRSQIRVVKPTLEEREVNTGSGSYMEYISSSYIEMVDNPDKEFDYMLRYTEFISPMIKSIQELSKKLETLENKLSSSGN